jgi:hypothetical protein
MLSELSEDDHTTMLDQTSTKTSVTVTATSSNSGAQTADVKASYQSNVKTIYTHLEEIIKKLLAHKEAWTQKYPPSPRQQATLSRTADSSASDAAISIGAGIMIRFSGTMTISCRSQTKC